MILALPFRDTESNFLISSAPRRHTLSWNGRPMKIEALASIANGRSMRNLWNFEISLNCTFEFHAQSLKFLNFTDCPNCNTPTTFLNINTSFKLPPANAEVRSRHSQTQTQTQTQTQRCRDTETQRHRDAEPQRRRDTETQRRRDTETNTFRVSFFLAS